MRRFSAETVTVGVVTGLGLYSVHVALGFDDARRWVPDFATGMALVVVGAVVWRRDRGTAVLLAVTGALWFAANLVPATRFWHRGPLFHAIAAYRGWRPRTLVASFAVVAGYAGALATPAWRHELSNIAAAITLMAVALTGYVTATDGERRDSRFALAAAALVSVAVAGGALARLATGSAVLPALHVYEAALISVAFVLAAGLRTPDAGQVADLVVDLDRTRSAGVRDALARELGDPTLEIGFLGPSGEFVDPGGRRIAIPGPGSDRVATFLDGELGRFAVLVHDPTVLRDPALIGAVTSVARMSQANAALTAEVRQQLVELADSRRRLVTAVDDERRTLMVRVREGAERNLLGAQRRLRALTADVAAGSQVDVHLRRAGDHLDHAIAELDGIADGLHPPDLAAGLDAALWSMAGRMPVDTRVSCPRVELPDDVSVAAYFVCAEALANIVKHAAAHCVAVTVTVGEQAVVIDVADDGVGGADRSRGTGLIGLADRVQALGGTLRLLSPPGAGTRLVAELPLGDQCE